MEEIVILVKPIFSNYNYFNGCLKCIGTSYTANDVNIFGHFSGVEGESIGIKFILLRLNRLFIIQGVSELVTDISVIGSEHQFG